MKESCSKLLQLSKDQGVGLMTEKGRGKKRLEKKGVRFGNSNSANWFILDAKLFDNSDEVIGSFPTPNYFLENRKKEVS